MGGKRPPPKNLNIRKDPKAETTTSKTGATGTLMLPSNESFALAGAAWVNDGGSVDQQYYRQQIKVVDQRLAPAALRLAALLTAAEAALGAGQDEAERRRSRTGVVHKSSRVITHFRCGKLARIVFPTSPGRS